MAFSGPSRENILPTSNPEASQVTDSPEAQMADVGENTGSGNPWRITDG
jgi:hypothetical protein